MASVQIKDLGQSYLTKDSGLKQRLLFSATIISNVIYILWRIFFTIPFDYGTVSLIFGLSLLIVEAIGTFESFEHYYNMSNIMRPVPPAPPLNWYPDVDVFIATYNEPVELLRKTINGCLNMDYPDKNKVHIFVCDDGNRPEMKTLTEKMGVGYITRDNNLHAKAGNLNNAMQNTFSPLIATFDADMIPMHNFLTECVPFFYMSETNEEGAEKKKIGFIQTPQCFYNPDLFQYNLYSENRIPDEQDYFYRDVQISRNKTNSVIYGGSNTVISRMALNDAGGFCTGVITEDFATGIMIQKMGYTCYAIDKPLASGLSPTDISSLIKQRIRWARGCIQTGYKVNILFGKGLTLKQRMSYLASILYWYNQLKRLIFILAPIVFSVFNVVILRCTLLEILIFWLPMYVFGNITLKRLSGNIRNTRWTNVYETVLFPYLLPHVIMEALGVKKRTFSVTKKDRRTNQNTDSKRYAIPHLILSALSVIGIVNCIRLTFVTSSMTYIVVIFWLANNLHSLIMATLFMLGRTIKRKSERYKVRLSCTIAWGEETPIDCQTSDISETGFMTKLDFPHFIPDDAEPYAVIKGERIASRFQCRVVSVTQVGTAENPQYRYAFEITSIAFDEQNALYRIIYDRIPSLPDKLGDDNSLFDDIMINISSRVPKKNFFNRRLPRIPIDRSIDAEECPNIRMVNFNYAFVLLDEASLPQEYSRLTIPVGSGLKLHCTFEKASDGFLLYKVLNYKEIGNDEIFTATLRKWIQERMDQEKRINHNASARRQNLSPKAAADKFEFNEREYLDDVLV